MKSVKQRMHGCMNFGEENMSTGHATGTSGSDLYESWHSRIIDTMLNAGIVFNINPRQLHGAQDKRTDLRCWCQRSFQSTTALAVHQWKAHGTHAPEFYLAKDTYCPCCLRTSGVYNVSANI